MSPARLAGTWSDRIGMTIATTLPSTIAYKGPCFLAYFQVALGNLYPFPGRDLGQALSGYPQDAELVWAQEEPRNMGGWRFVREQFLDGKVEGLDQIGRAH